MHGDEWSTAQSMTQLAWIHIPDIPTRDSKIPCGQVTKYTNPSDDYE